MLPTKALLPLVSNKAALFYKHVTPCEAQASLPTAIAFPRKAFCPEDKLIVFSGRCVPAQ